MQTFPYELEYYVNAAGKKPFKEWLEGLRDVSGRAKIRVHWRDYQRRSDHG